MKIRFVHGRLNHRLEVACRKTIQQLCPDACAKPEDAEGCGGTVLNCLTQKAANITNPSCQRVHSSAPWPSMRGPMSAASQSPSLHSAVLVSRTPRSSASTAGS